MFAAQRMHDQLERLAQPGSALHRDVIVLAVMLQRRSRFRMVRTISTYSRVRVSSLP